MRSVLSVTLAVVVCGLAWGQDKPDKKPAEKKNVVVDVQLDEFKPAENKDVVVDVQFDEKANPKAEVVFQVKDGASNSDKSLDALEAKLQALLKEIQALRAAKATQPTPPAQRSTPKTVRSIRLNPSAVKQEVVKPVIVAQPRIAAPNHIVVRSADPKAIEQKRAVIIEAEGKPKTGEAYRLEMKMVGAGDGGVVNLTRASYQMPAANAKALNEFLTSHVKASVMETRVEGDKITVTTTPEAQQTIGALVALMLGKAPAKTSIYQYTPTLKSVAEPVRYRQVIGDKKPLTATGKKSGPVKPAK